MKQLKFRTLRAEEIEVRPATVKDGKATLLLYIDSRAVVDILNETVGEMNWTMDFYEANGKLVGKLGIWDEDKNMFIYKCDTGSESNIEAEKGLFSDCYKRCLSRWGVQELYSAPRIYINSDDKFMTYKVTNIQYNDNREIIKLTITNKYNKTVFNWKIETNYENLNYVEETISDKPDRIIELEDFYLDKQREDGINIKSLNKFCSFLKQPDNNFPNKTIAETRRFWNLNKLWEKWIEREYNTAS